ncbi:MAG: class I SAM-dependent methyltransferase [Deltaproteobacteria bacterium]|nr:class I SAM-dependent methyltransferase [Deltaproteobacteria bacterium]
MNPTTPQKGALFPASSMPDRDWWDALWPDPAKVMALMGAAPGQQVVDLCCGDGLFTIPLARLVKPGRVTAIELLPDMMAKARDCLAKMEAGGSSGTIRFIQGDVMDLGRLVEEKAHWILMANTFHGVPDKPGLGRAVASRLLPGGWFGVINWHPRPQEETTVLGRPRGPQTPMRMAPQAVLEELRPAGFTRMEVVELPPYHYGAKLFL